jgi:hypothetical protein
MEDQINKAGTHEQQQEIREVHYNISCNNYLRSCFVGQYKI